MTKSSSIQSGYKPLVTAPGSNPDDQVLDQTLRPDSFSLYVGQDKIKANLNIILSAAKKRNEAPEHILLHGPSGLGKTTLAYIIAKELGSNLRMTSGTALQKAGDVGSILTGLQDGDVLFIDEVHRLNKAVEEVIYPAMENFRLDIIIGKGNSAKTLQLNLAKFTLIAATTKISLLSAPFRSRFGASFRFDFYTDSDIQRIVSRSAKLLGVSLDTSAIRAIAEASRATPRIANRLLKRVRDYSQVHGVPHTGINAVKSTLAMLDVDPKGLEDLDRKIMLAVAQKFNGGPVGLKSIAASIAEEEETLEDVYEPYLIRLGLLSRTPKGRVLTSAGYKYLALPERERKLEL